MVLVNLYESNVGFTIVAWYRLGGAGVNWAIKIGVTVGKAVVGVWVIIVTWTGFYVGMGIVGEGLATAAAT